MKGVIQSDHIPLNKYTLAFIGMVPLTPIEISGLEEELETMEMPDRTVATGGNTKATEFTMVIPAHHLLEQAAMEAWFLEGQEPVSPAYKKVGTLIMQSVSGAKVRSFSLIGTFTKGRALPDLEMANEGEMAGITWTMSVDQILPI